MKGLLELIKLLYGPRALSKTIGTRTNVIRLPNKEMKRYIKEELNIEAASDKLAQKAYKEMQELIPEIPKMNDAERLIFEGNLRRLKSKLNIRSAEDPTAEVIEFGTKQKVSPKGIETLVEQAGQKSPPGTLMGNLESRIKQLEARGEDLSKMKGQTFDEIIGDVMETQKTASRLQDEGLVRAAVRYKMMDDLKRGTLKLPKNLEDVVRGASNEEDVITVFRTNYGEDALEQVDSLIPDFYNMSSATEAVKAIEQKFPNIKPRKIEVKQVMDLDEALKAEQEQRIIPSDSPEGKKITEGLIGKPKASVTELMTADKVIQDMTKMDPMDAMKEANKVLKKEGPYKNLKEEDVKRIMDETEDHIFGRNLPEDEFAKGGRVGYSDGTKPSAAENTPSQEIINRMIAQIKQLSKRGVDIATIKDIVGASDQMIKDVLGKASGGSMSKGLDYLTGIERRGYADGTDLETPVYRILADGTRGPRVITDAMVKSVFGDSSYDGEDLKRVFGDNITFMSQEGYDKEKALNQQQTPTQDNMVSPEDALTPELPSVNPLQQHFDQNQMLKDAVTAGTITPEQYNILGGYDVTQNLAGGNPLIGGIGNLIGSTAYNVVQSMKGDQPFSDIPGDVARNVQGGLGMISPELKQTYQDIINQRLPYMQQDQQNYQQRIAQVNPNELVDRYKQNLSTPASSNVDNFKSQLQSNLQGGLNYLTGL